MNFFFVFDRMIAEKRDGSANETDRFHRHLWVRIISLKLPSAAKPELVSNRTPSRKKVFREYHALVVDFVWHSLILGLKKGSPVDSNRKTMATVALAGGVYLIFCGIQMIFLMPSLAQQMNEFMPTNTLPSDVSWAGVTLLLAGLVCAAFASFDLFIKKAEQETSVK